MISNKLIESIANVANKNNLVNVIIEVCNHIRLNKYSFSSDALDHILNMCFDSKAIKAVNDINLNYIEENFKTWLYGYDKYNIKNINVISVDNIACEVTIRYEYIEKINEDADRDYMSSSIHISFIDYPQVLKNS